MPDPIVCRICILNLNSPHYYRINTIDEDIRAEFFCTSSALLRSYELMYFILIGLLDK
jgi:hypothetical protein